MKFKILLVFAFFLLVACGEESETVRVTERYTLDMLGKGVSLTEELCDSARMGQLLYVGDSSSIYYCTGKVWKRANGVNGKDGRDGKDGKDGVDGKKGKYGESGTDCFIDQFADGFSLGCGSTKAVIRFNFEIPDTCSIELDEDSSYVLGCGNEKAKLRQGAQGDAGDICGQTDIGGGKVRLVCGNDSVTTYKAQCGETPFDPDGSQFCYGDSLVERCGTHAYDIKKQFCYEDSVVDMCGGKIFNPAHEFCFRGSIRVLCGGETYDPETHFCYRGSLPEECPGEDYDIYYWGCAPILDYSLGTIVSRCGGKMYDPNLQYCKNGVRYGTCAGVEYNFDQEYCYEGSLVPRCPEKWSDREFCDRRNGRVYSYTIIGGKTWMAENLDYKVSNSFCDSSFRDDDLHCGQKGRFYPWSVAMQLSEAECGYEHNCSDRIVYPHQGVCPKGWHIPTKDEWETLVQVMGEEDLVYWGRSVNLYDRGKVRAEDPFGFSAIPTGTVEIEYQERNQSFHRKADGTIYPNGFDAWSSTETESGKSAYVCFFYADNSYEGLVQIKAPLKREDRTVRCVKDEVMP